MSSADSFYALRSGYAPQIGEATQAPGRERGAVLTVSDLGHLVVTSGRMVVCDSASLGTGPVGPQSGRLGSGLIPVFDPVPLGRHPVRLTSADRSGSPSPVHAYLSVVFSEEPTATIEPWIAVGGESVRGEPADNFVSVESGIIGLLDAAAAPRAPIRFNDAWPQNIPCDNLAPPFTEGDASLVFCRCSVGAFPVIATRDAAATVTGLHIDFAIVGPSNRKQWWKSRHTHAHTDSRPMPSS
ncbi:hypothetical protein AB0C34_08985 [Nocardia sp. NPDC049220]|uniref:hypothetical protein n=1 Tax=Nocardia sp. NPDC049220 TaxID=3155273 RepID=UPI00340662F9